MERTASVIRDGNTMTVTPSRGGFGTRALRPLPTRRSSAFGVMMSLTRNSCAVFLVVTAVLLIGCARHYWSKPNSQSIDFLDDHVACAQQVALSSNQLGYGLVPTNLYRACMRSLGWLRTKEQEPAPAGYFRGIEDDEIVKLDQIPEQDSARPLASGWKREQCRRTYLKDRSNWRDYMAQYDRCLNE
jgi:hypothetical protein